MKKTIFALFTSVFLLLFAGNLFAQKSNTYVKKLEIKTSAQCNMCKERIEKEMAYTKGVKTFTLDITTKILTVTYDEKKTNPDKIRQAISKLGYDADDVAADAKTYAKLPSCCKKPTDKNAVKCDD